MMRIYKLGGTLLLILRFAAAAAQTSRTGLTNVVPRNAQEVSHAVVAMADHLESQQDSMTEEIRDDPKCTAAGYYSLRFEQDEYDLRSWENTFIHRGINTDAAYKKSCKSASANARGTYTSHLVPCTFRFFQIPSEQPGDLSHLVTSTACFDTSPMQNLPEFNDYIVKWPDECLADFVRCYDLKRDEKILLRYICKNGDLKFPEGATHVSVNCTEDQKEKQERIKSREADRDDDPNDPFLKHNKEALKQERDSKREFHMVVLAVVFLFLFAGCFGFCFTYRYVVKPFLAATLKRSRSDSELSSLKANVAVDSEKEG